MVATPTPLKCMISVVSIDNHIHYLLAYYYSLTQSSMSKFNHGLTEVFTNPLTAVFLVPMKIGFGRVFQPSSV